MSGLRRTAGLVGQPSRYTGETDVFGLRFGASPRDIARAVADQIASRVGLQCRR